MPDEFTLELRRVLHAPPRKVFDALTRPELMRRWMCPENFAVVLAEGDARPGGRFRISMRSPEGDVFTAAGSYLEVRASERLVFTWTWEAGHDIDGLETRVQIDLVPEEGQTLLVMAHSGLPSEEERNGHERGWTGALGHLEQLILEGSSE
jgi:uncharacterized protein YndB with AHSA1/START domain